MRSEYLLFDLLIFFSASSGPLFSRWLAGWGYWPRWKAFGGALLAVSLPFIVWDHFVTNWWWYFSEQYTLGIHLGSLPIEEILFFVVVPWGCLVLWNNIRPEWKKKRVAFPVEGVLALPLLLLGVIAVLNSWWYTASVSLLLPLVIGATSWKKRWLNQASTLLFLGGVFVLTLVFNGYLTARPIVTYNPAIITNWRIWTVPIEDFLYGYILVGGVVWVYEQLKRRLTAPKHTADHPNTP